MGIKKYAYIGIITYRYYSCWSLAKTLIVQISLPSIPSVLYNCVIHNSSTVGVGLKRIGYFSIQIFFLVS